MNEQRISIFFVLCKRGLIPQSFSFPDTNKGIGPFCYIKNINPSNFQILPMNYLLSRLHRVAFISTVSSEICRTAAQIRQILESVGIHPKVVPIRSGQKQFNT